MATVPIAGGNAIFSEFEADSSGNAQFFTVLMQNPALHNESVLDSLPAGMRCKGDLWPPPP